MAKKEKVEKQGIDKILETLETKYGLGRAKVEDLIIVNTGSIQLNRATGINGIPLGKIIELFGQESSGKTTITLHLIAEFQKAFPEKKVALFDFEHSYDKKYATNVGVNNDKLLIYQPDYMEIGYDMILGLIEKDIVSLVVLDSQTAAMPKAVIDGDMGDATIGLAARINSKFCGKIKGLLAIHNSTLVSISQTRANIGGMTPGDISTGGNCWKFYADMRWKVWKMNDKIGELNKTTIDIIKNKISNPFGQAKMNILWGLGYDKIGEIIDYACDFNILKKGGAWFAFRDEKFQGTDKLKVFLEDNPEVLDYITQEVMKNLEKDIKIEEPIETD